MVSAWLFSRLGPGVQVITASSPEKPRSYPVLVAASPVHASVRLWLPAVGVPLVGFQAWPLQALVYVHLVAPASIAAPLGDLPRHGRVEQRLLGGVVQWPLSLIRFLPFKVLAERAEVHHVGDVHVVHLPDVRHDRPF